MFSCENLQREVNKLTVNYGITTEIKDFVNDRVMTAEIKTKKYV